MADFVIILASSFLIVPGEAGHGRWKQSFVEQREQVKINAFGSVLLRLDRQRTVARGLT